MSSPATTPFAPSTATFLGAPCPRTLFRHAVRGSLRKFRRGSLRLEYPDGCREEFGAPGDAPAVDLPLGIAGRAEIRVRSEAFFRRCVLGGDIGFAEAWMAGEWDTPDLPAVIAWFILNLDQAPTLSGSTRRRARLGLINLLRFVHRLEHRLRANSRRQSRVNISHHYDLSNTFFALFLDSSLMYSSGLWTRPDLSLAEAQEEKNEALCRQLRLGAHDHVLEIGSGWGGWALHAARTRGCRVTTLTLSQQQQALASRRIAEAGLSDRIEVRLQDYRDVQGRYDKIISIEMMEAVGHTHLPDYCRALARALKPEGLVALQYITIPDARYGDLRRGVDFIQKYIFPGSLLLSLNRVNDLLGSQGGFVLHGLQDLGHDYARTLRVWRENFHRQLEGVKALGFDERFIRMWDYYLAYCESAFALRNISVVQALYTRPNNFRLA